MSLKVLHKLLDERKGRVTFIGISNGSLDPAKMNRCAYLFRDDPSVTDLALTGRALFRDEILRKYANILAKIFLKVYEAQNRPFWDMREYYSLVKMLDENPIILSLPAEQARMIMSNFGGQAESLQVLNSFLQAFGSESVVKNLTLPDSIELIKENLQSNSSRFLMILTKNDAALSILFQRNILRHPSENIQSSGKEAQIIFGSDLDGDRQDACVTSDLHRIKLAMAQGNCVILIHDEHVYESCYDLFNQHWQQLGNTNTCNVGLWSKFTIVSRKRFFQTNIDC